MHNILKRTGDDSDTATRYSAINAMVRLSKTISIG